MDSGSDSTTEALAGLVEPVTFHSEESSFCVLRVKARVVHHSDRGSQYLSIKYTQRLAEAAIDLSVGTVGDAYDNALAECVIGLFKTEVINQISPWKSMREVEWETLKWVDWYNNRRLLGPIGYITHAEAEEAFYANLNTLDMVA